MLGTGDSDFTPLVHKLRELNRRVIGIGVEASTSALLPPACDEFLFYERLEGVEPAEAPSRRGRRVEPVAPSPTATRGAVDEADRVAELPRTPTSACSSRRRSPGLERSIERPGARVDAEAHDPAQGPDVQRGRTTGSAASASCCATSPTAVSSSCTRGQRAGRPRGARSRRSAGDEDAAFALLRSTVERLTAKGGPPHLSGPQDPAAQAQPDFSEKKFGYGGFLQFCKAARARGVIEMEFDDDADDYFVRPVAVTSEVG